MTKARSVITHIDHFVLTVRSLKATCAFYQRVRDCRRVDAPNRPTELHFGEQKINVHEAELTFEPKAKTPTPGAADFCLITDRSLTEVQVRLDVCGVAIELGPVPRIGAQEELTSLYFRDPDGNLIEVSSYDR